MDYSYLNQAAAAAAFEDDDRERFAANLRRLVDEALREGD